MEIKELGLYELESSDLFLAQSYFEVEEYRNSRMLGYIVCIKDSFFFKKDIYSVCKYNSDKNRKVKRFIRIVTLYEYILFMHSKNAILYYLCENTNPNLFELFYKKYKVTIPINKETFLSEFKEEKFYENIKQNLTNQNNDIKALLNHYN